MANSKIVQLTVAMFNAAPGAANLAAMEGFYAANSSSLSALADALAASSLFSDQFTGMNNSQIADAAIAHFGLSRAVMLPTEATSAYNFFKTELDKGASIQSLMVAAVDFLAIPANAAAFPTASATLANKATVAEYYSVTKALSANTIADLKSVVASVTADTASVTTAETAVDALGTVTGSSFMLTDGRDLVTGTAGDDTIYGTVGQNQNGAVANAFATGDVINAGTGTDTVVATLMNDNEVDGANANFDINVTTTGVEVVKLTVLDEGVRVDAGAMDSVAQFWSVNSDDSGLVLEDVRTGATQITKDITFGMKDVDFESDLTAMFDSNSFKKGASTSSNSQILIEAGYEDAPADVSNTNPAKDLFIKVKFTHDGKAFDSGYLNTSTNATDAFPDTYEGLKGLLEAALTAQGFGNLTVEFGNDITSITTDAGVKALQVTAKQILIKDPAGKAFTGVTSAAGAESTDPTSDVASRILAVDPTVVSQLIESNLILDNAGRGSTAGDVMIGAMSNSNAGIEKFNVMVDRSSAIESLKTTNGKLQQIAITSLTNNGDLEIGELDANITLVDASAFKGANLMLGTTVEANRANTDAEDHTAGANFNGDDTATTVRVDNLKTLSAAITGNVTYMGKTTEGTLTSSGNTFTYTTGSGNDTVDVELDGDSVDSKGESFTINAGDGSNKVTVKTVDGVSYETMAGLKNMSITTGSGVDTIKNIGIAQFDITAGAGSDMVYIDSIDAGSNAAEVQRIDLTGATNADGNVTVGGVTVAVLAADTVATTATKIAAAINGAATGTAIGDATAVADATGVTINYTAAYGNVAQATVVDGTGSITGEVASTTTSGSQVGTKGEWTISVTDEDGSAALATFEDRVLYKATVTVNFAGFESTAAVATTAANNFVATQIDINTAIIAAINANPELKQLLSTTLTTDAKGLTIKSLVEGNNDLTIDLFQPTAVTIAAANAREVQLGTTDLAAIRLGLIQTLDLNTADNLISNGISDDSEDVETLAEIANIMNANVGETIGAETVAAKVTGHSGDGHLTATGQSALANGVNGNTVDTGAYTFFASASGTDGLDAVDMINNSIINMGTGANDLLVLNSDSDSAQTVKFTAAWDKVSIVNFFTTNATGNGIDGIANIYTGSEDGDLSDATASLNKIDFTTWLDDKLDNSPTTTGYGPLDSANRIATTDAVVGAAALAVTAANQVVIVNDFIKGTVADVSETWANLTADVLDKALEGTTQGTNGNGWGNLFAIGADAVVTDNADNFIDGITDVATGTDTAKIDSIFMIENDDNQGEYKVFNVEWSNIDNTSGTGTIEDAVVTLLGTVDFGETITAGAVFA